MSKKSKSGDGTYAKGVKGLSEGSSEKETVARTLLNLCHGLTQIRAWKWS